MRVCENGIYRDLTPEEIAEMEAQAAEQERQYWLNISYDEAVVSEIRKKYTLDQELAINRQRDKKPEEFEAFDAYCEECKCYVKTRMAEVAREVESL